MAMPNHLSNETGPGSALNALRPDAVLPDENQEASLKLRPAARQLPGQDRHTSDNS
jgi:hypothetical protein